MKLKSLRLALPLAAAALVIPADVAADCFFGNYRLHVNFADEGAKEVAGSTSFADGQSVFAGDIAFQLSPKLALGGGAGFCSSGGSSAVSIGGRAVVDAFRSPDGWAVQVGLAAGTASFEGNRTVTVPVSAFVTFPVEDDITVAGGAAIQFQRFSNDVISVSNDNFGLLGSVQYDLNENVDLVGGVDIQFYSGSSQASLNLAARFAIDE